jgi:hypothetical protein
MSRAERIGYARERKQQMLDDIERDEIKAKHDVIGPFRNFLIKSHAPDALRNALDDWTEELSGDRTFFWSRHTSVNKKAASEEIRQPAKS